MTPISTRIIAVRALLALSICLAIAFLVAPGAHLRAARAQTGNAAKADKPVYHDYKGVELSMTQDEVRKKLGSPKDKDDTQDFYIFSDKETAQVFYQQKKVIAVSVSYMGNKAGAPEVKSVLGADVQPAADGRIYKMVRYPEAGFWVSYSRISGEEPMVTVTMQKLQ
jgi:outer membrane protein assembly factor BamE (lipoprotein component of BamABCDE complex)